MRRKFAAKMMVMCMVLMIVFCGGIVSCGKKTGKEIQPENVTGSHDGGQQDSASVTSDGDGVTIPVYSVQDDLAAAEYLKEQYDILRDGKVPKVIFDTDMAFSGDDAMCLSLLTAADQIGLIELLGVTITGGNSFVAVGTNAALVLLEKFGREDIPVYMGEDEPIGGFRDLAAQEQIIGRIDRWGVMWHLEDYIPPQSYHELGSYYERKWGYSQTKPQTESSADFMIMQVSKYPGEVVILSAGAATNIALACEKDGSFAENTAGIIYMGTIAEGGGTYTPYADFNVFYDAEAFRICLESAFPVQMIVPHDAAASVRLDKNVFDLMDAKQRTLMSQLWLDDQYSLYRRSPNKTAGCTDAALAVTLLYPQAVSRREALYITVNTDTADARYGETVMRKVLGSADSEAAADGSDVGGTRQPIDHDPDASARVTVLLEFDTALYWDFATDLLCHTQEKLPYGYGE